MCNFFLSVFESQRFFGRPFGCGCAAVDETTSVVHVFEALRTNVEPTIWHVKMNLTAGTTRSFPNVKQISAIGESYSTKVSKTTLSKRSSPLLNKSFCATSPKPWSRRIAVEFAVALGSRFCIVCCFRRGSSTAIFLSRCYGLWLQHWGRAMPGELSTSCLCILLFVVNNGQGLFYCRR